MASCPQCKGEPRRVLYLGFPMWLCDCSCLFGFWSWVAVHLQVEDGGWSFIAYEGSYLRALWHWLRGGTEG